LGNPTLCSNLLGAEVANEKGIDSLVAWLIPTTPIYLLTICSYVHSTHHSFAYVYKYILSIHFIFQSTKKKEEEW